MFNCYHTNLILKIKNPFICFAIASATSFAAEPIVTSSPITNINQGEDYRYTLSADDADNDRLTWSIANPNIHPQWLALTIGSNVSTLAGSGEAGIGDNENGQQASFNMLWGITGTQNNQIYVGEYNDFKVRSINTLSGTVTTIAGSGEFGDEDNAVGLLAKFGNIYHLATDNDGNILITDTSNHKIRKINGQTFEVSTIAGSGIQGGQDHQYPTLAQFDKPRGIAVDSNGFIYISEVNRIRKIDPTTFAVSTLISGDNQPNDQSILVEPNGLIADTNNQLYIVDSNRILKIDLNSSEISLFAGNQTAGDTDNDDPLQSRFNQPRGITIGQGYLFIADTNNHKIRQINLDTGKVSTYAGNGIAGNSNNNDGLQASFNLPTALFATSEGDIFINDWLNHQVRLAKTTSELTGSPTNNDVGSHNVELTVSDGNNEVPHSFSVTVANINDAPTISGIAPDAYEDQPYQFSPIANDVDSNTTLNFSVSNLPSWASFNPQNGTIEGIPENHQVGNYSNITIEVSDGELSAQLPTFDLQVINTNDAPTIEGTPNTQVTMDEHYSFTPTANDIDTIHGDTLSFTIENKPTTWGSFDQKTGTFAGTPSRANVGQYQNIIISVTDGIEQVPLTPFNIEVIANNTKPVAFSTSQSISEDRQGNITFNASDDDNDPLTYHIITEPIHGTLTSTDQPNVFSYLPETNYYGLDQVQFKVNDGLLDSDIATISINVQPIDDLEAATDDLYRIDTPTVGSIHSFDVLSNDNIDPSLQIIGAFSIDGQVWIENQQLNFKHTNPTITVATVEYILIDAEQKQSKAVVTIIMD